MAASEWLPELVEKSADLKPNFGKEDDAGEADGPRPSYLVLLLALGPAAAAALHSTPGTVKLWHAADCVVVRLRCG